MLFPHAESALARAWKSVKSRRSLGFLFGLGLAALPLPAAADAMLTGGLTSQPIGHYEFCRHHPDECGVRPADQRPEHMTNALWERIVDVNVAVNAAIEPVNDIDLYGVDEVWAYPDSQGDCEDYVLAKRRTLEETGISLANLLITVVRKPDGEGHAILTLRTDEGDFVLDNLTDAVRGWQETDYRFLKRQASEDTGRWVAIRGGSPVVVGSVD